MKKGGTKRSTLESRPAWCSSSRRATTIGMDATFGHVVNTKYQPQVEAGRRKKGLNTGGRASAKLSSKAKRRFGRGPPQRVTRGGNPASLIRDLASRSGGEAMLDEEAGEGKEDAGGVDVAEDYVSSLEQQNYLLQTEVEYARALMNEEPELGTTMDDQIDRFKRSHAAQIRRYDLKMRNMRNRNTELEAQLASLTRAHYLLQETNRNTREKLDKLQANADTAKLGKLSFEIGRDHRVRELSGEVMSFKALLEKSDLAKSEMESEYAAAKQSMKHRIDKYSLETEEASNKLASANARIRDLEAENTTLTEDLDLTKEALARAKDAEAGAESDRDSAIAKLRIEESKSKQLELVNESLQEEGRKLTEANTRLEGQLTSAMQEIEGHMQRIERMTKAMAEGNAERGTLRQALSHALEANASHPKLIAAAQRKFEEASVRLASARTDLEEAQKREVSLKELVTEAENSRLRANEEAATSDAQTRLLREREQELRQNLDQLYDAHVRANSRIEVLEIERQAWKERAKRANAPGNAIDVKKLEEMMKANMNVVSELGKLANSLADVEVVEEDEDEDLAVDLPVPRFSAVQGKKMEAATAATTAESMRAAAAQQEQEREEEEDYAADLGEDFEDDFEEDEEEGENA